MIKQTLNARRAWLQAAFGALVVATVLASTASAELRIDITQGRADPMPVAIAEFTGETASENGVGNDIATVVAADLERSGLFRPIEKRAFIQRDLSLVVPPRFGDWRVLNAQALVHGRTSRLPDGRLRVEFRLWDVFAGQQMLGVAYHTTPQNWRRIAHIVADAIYKRITGEEGYFDTRVVYVSETGPQNKRITRLAIMDQDGANHRFLTDGSSLVLSPRFSPTLQEITYLAFRNNQARVYLRNLDIGREEVLGSFDGMTFAPRFSPDGASVVMSHERSGNTDIYLMDLRTRRARQLTDDPSIDVSPSMSPDGKFVVFNSDRGGSQQLYVMDSDGRNQKRISFGQGRYATPNWSPRGDYIAFTKINAGQFYIGVMRPDGSGERILSQGFRVEGPTWAPNGRVLMFYKQIPWDRAGSGGGKRIFSIDLTGYNERELVTPVDGSDPAWSPLNPS